MAFVMSGFCVAKPKPHPALSPVFRSRTFFIAVLYIFINLWYNTYYDINNFRQWRMMI